MCDPANYLNALKLSQLDSHLILTKCFEELSRGELPIEENGVVVGVERSAHAYQQHFQTAWKGTHRQRQRHGEMQEWRKKRKGEGWTESAQDTPTWQHNKQNVNKFDPDWCTAYIRHFEPYKNQQDNMNIHRFFLKFKRFTESKHIVQYMHLCRRYIYINMYVCVCVLNR